MGRNMKRSRAHHGERDHDAAPSRGVAGTLQQLNEPNGPEWQTVERRSKKQKMSKSARQAQERSSSENNKPTLAYAQQHKLTTMVKVGDLQGLVLYCVGDGTSPQWISVRNHGQIRRAVVLLVPGLEMGMFTGQIELSAPPTCEENDGLAIPLQDEKEPAKAQDGAAYDAHASSYRNPDEYLPINLTEATLPPALKPLASVFDRLWPIKAPGDDKYYKLHSPLHAMLTSPIPKSQEEKLSDKQFKGGRPPRESKDWRDQRTPIIEYLASNDELQEHDFAIHPACFSIESERTDNTERRKATKTTEAEGWKDTLIQDCEEGLPADGEVQAGSVTAGRTVLCIDCEMCMVEGEELALTRVSILGWDGEVILDEYVKPEKPITNYLTPYSGITAETLATVITTLTDIQSRLLQIFHPQTILVGHSLDSDLRALKMTHPFIVDTSMLYPHPRGAPLKSSLKWLSQKYLRREIQKGHGTSGHDSIEDARATLDLVKLKCEKGPSWGGSQANSEPLTKRLLRASSTHSSATSHEDWNGRISAVIDHGTPERTFGSLASHCIGCQDDAEVVAGIRRAVFGDVDGFPIPGEGVRFTWARLRELEALQGWWNDNKSDKRSTTDHLALPSAPDPAALAAAVSRTTEHIVNVRKFLPSCTLLIVYSGSGDPRELARLQEMQRAFKREYAIKKWDELSVRWTDVEEQALKAACRSARAGLGLVCVT